MGGAFCRRSSNGVACSYLRTNSLALIQFLPSAMAQYTNIVFGVILALILIVRPDGIITKKLLYNFGLSLARNMH
ncbi:MAG: hypothetical protein JSV25_12790 [Spirochaetota bacterium]|nr:MAG: hypothetical protein JSV25_12790 [Spirochaetota bacterium]